MAKSVAVVTGASSGIGEALARRIARDKRNLVLVARRADRLEALAKELAAAQGIEATAIPCDLIAPDGPASLIGELAGRGLEVEWLVNNAGFGTMGRFHELPIERELDEIHLNVTALVALTPGRLASALVTLELEGRARQLEGQRWVAVPVRGDHAAALTRGKVETRCLDRFTSSTGPPAS
jgi:short-subunit dehydrogenase